MKYEKNQYTEGVTLCGSIFTGALLWWGIVGLLIGDWGGLIPLFFGILFLSGGIIALSSRKKLRNAVKDEIENHPNASVDEISNYTNITKKDVRAIILHLKAEGELRGKFSAKSGKLKDVQVQLPGKSIEINKKYCPNCGTELMDEEAKYCNYCGSNLYEEVIN